jgi:hemin uptake protein HemP
MPTDHDSPQPRLEATPTPPPVPGAEAPRHVDSAHLLGTRGEVYIVHRQQLYRLRETAQGKLILTK